MKEMRDTELKSQMKDPKSRNPDHIVIGCANINIFTGQSSIFEYETTFHMNPTQNESKAGRMLNYQK